MLDIECFQWIAMVTVCYWFAGFSLQAKEYLPENTFQALCYTYSKILLIHTFLDSNFDAEKYYALKALIFVWFWFSPHIYIYIYLANEAPTFCSSTVACIFFLFTVFSHTSFPVYSMGCFFWSDSQLPSPLIHISKIHQLQMCISVVKEFPNLLNMHEGGKKVI